jgi:hypothetical protein
MRNRPRGAAIYGIDIGKHRFDVVGLDDAGAMIHRTKFRRDTLLAHFAMAPKALVGMKHALDLNGSHASSSSSVTTSASFRPSS